MRNDMPPLTRRLLRGAFYLASAAVGVLSLAPAAALPAAPISDKVEHAVAYALLALLGCTTSRRGVLRTMIGVSVFGTAIEMLQGFSPGRSPDVLDALANIAGAALACSVVAMLRRSGIGPA